MATFKEKLNECTAKDERLDGKTNINIRLLSDAILPRCVFVDNIYFTGINVMRCYAGRFHFSFNDRESVELGTDNLIVIYPKRYVTIKALEKENRIVYCTFYGSDIENFFDDLGFFDCARGRTSPRLNAFQNIRKQIDEANSTDVTHQRIALRLLTDILESQLADLKSNGHALLFEAAHLIHMNLKQGIVRLNPLCDELHVSRSHLHHKFIEAGLPSPAKLIRREQLRLAIRLLREGILPLTEVMRKSGFVSQSHFSTFIRNHTGKTPYAIRSGN